ncbi:hypothetical protein cypCar_00029809, partial [Cyprinus carpio]
VQKQFILLSFAERDAFDTLLDHAPDKLNVVKTSLITFVNKHLNKLNLEVTELESQFADGVYLVLLMGLLENYFVPLYNFYLTPESFEQKVHNVTFAFELMQDGGLQKPKARPEVKRMADCGAEEEKGEYSNRQGAERRMIIQPTSLEDPKLNKLKEVLVEWINKTLKIEHIVVKDNPLYNHVDTSVHVLIPGRLAGVQLHIDEIALSTDAQVRKLEMILTALNETLGLNEEKAKWNVKLIHSRDLLATLHLLVTMARHFQPDLVLPVNVSVEVIQCEVTKSGIKADKQTEFITFQSNSSEVLERESNKEESPIDELFKLEAHKIETVKKAILHFVNKNMSSLGLNVTDLDKQFADGVILLLLIGQLEGFFIPLSEFFLCPVKSSEMLHNVTLALDLLIDRGLPVQSVDPQDIVSQDAPATMRVLYYLFKKDKNK